LLLKRQNLCRLHATTTTTSGTAAIGRWDGTPLLLLLPIYWRRRCWLVIVLIVLIIHAHAHAEAHIHIHIHGRIHPIKTSQLLIIASSIVLFLLELQQRSVVSTVLALALTLIIATTARAGARGAAPAASSRAAEVLLRHLLFRIGKSLPQFRLRVLNRLCLRYCRLLVPCPGIVKCFANSSRGACG